MARITVEDCLEHVENRFKLVLLASKRARQLARTTALARVTPENDKPTVIALREIAAGHVDFHEEPATSLSANDSADESGGMQSAIG